MSGLEWTLLLAGFAGVVFLVCFVLEKASYMLYGKESRKKEALLKILPGENCGVCGFETCEKYAEALVEGTAAPNLCVIGGDEISHRICDAVGTPFLPTVRLRAQVLCSGTDEVSGLKYRYEGLRDCVSAAAGGNTPKECPYGCIGLGTCVRACPFGAIKVERGVAVVEYEKCRACGVCVGVCPQNIIRLVPFHANVWVGCSSHDRSSDLRRYCRVGCVGCRICEKVCPQGAIRVEDQLAQIDYGLCTSCGICADKCPRGILWRGDEQIRFGDVITEVRPEDGADAEEHAE